MSEMSRRLNDSLSSIMVVFSKFPRNLENWKPDNIFSIDEIFARIGTVGGLIDSLTTLPTEKFALVPAGRITGIANSYNNLVNSIDRTKSQFDLIEQWGGFGRFDDATGLVYANNGNPINLKSIFDEISGYIDSVLEAHIPIVATTQPRSVGTFVAAARDLRRQASEASRLVSDLSDQQAKLISTIESAVVQEARANQAATEAIRLSTDIAATRKTVEEQSSRVTSVLASVEALTKKAEELALDVDGYGAEFKNFQSALEGREAALEAGNERLTQLIASFNENQSKIENQIQEAGQMLGVATVSGLSSTYNEKSLSLDNQMKYARYTYYGAIVFMIASVLFTLNLIPNIDTHFPPVIPENAQDTGPLAIRVLAAIGARILVLLPSILLLTFASHQHSALFKIREQYSHKYNIAASVNGFKAQAPDYKEAIAAAVFVELLKNPIDYLQVESEENSNDFVQKIIGPAVNKALEQLNLKRSG